MNKFFFIMLLSPFIFSYAYGQNNSTQIDSSKLLLDSIPYVLGIAAFIISIISLWNTHLSPFKLVISSETPILKLYKLGTKNDKNFFLGEKEYVGNDWMEQQRAALDEEKKFEQIYWIPSIALSISFYNSGKKPGKILNIRAVLIRDHTDKPNKFALYPRGFVDLKKKWSEAMKSRNSISDSITSEWSPIILPPQETINAHLILEGPAWFAKLTGNWEIKMEVLTSKNEWECFQTLKTRIRQMVFDLAGTERYSTDYIVTNEQFDNQYYREKLIRNVKVIEGNPDSKDDSKNTEKK